MTPICPPCNHNCNQGRACPARSPIKKLAIVALLAATATQAAFYDGNKLLTRLQSRGTGDYLSALGYVTGASDAIHGVVHCAPNAVTAGQVADMVQQHLESNPSSRHLAADVHIAYVLKQAWPCPERRGGQPL